jgi:hypothetical protein
MVKSLHMYYIYTFFLLQVSETENIRKNLAIERMIVEGCDILLDVNQMFVRQGTLVQILPPGSKQGTRGTY